MCWCFSGWCASTFLLFVTASQAQSIYGVSIDTSKIRGKAGSLVFEFTANLPLSNRVDIVNFATDGAFGIVETKGGAVTGDLVEGLNPARFTRIKTGEFLNELMLPFSAFGDRIEFVLNISETGPRRDRPPDKFSLYIADNSAGPQERAALRGPQSFSVTVTGRRGGSLEFQSARGQARPSSVDPQAQLRDEDLPFRVPVAVVNGSTGDDSRLFEHAATYEGELNEFCNRRCAGQAICTGGAFMLSVSEEKFYKFDDVSNLKTQVALIERGTDPRFEGRVGRARVVAIQQNSVLTVKDIEIY
jgi:hypothetical protein